MWVSALVFVASLSVGPGAAAEPPASPAAKLSEALEGILAIPSPAALQTEPSGDVTVDFSATSKALAVLAEAQRAEQERKWRRAAELYQRLLDEAPVELANPSPRLYVPVRTCVEERLAAFAPEGLAEYRRQVDRQANELFVAAVAGGDLARLAEVAHRFLLSSCGDNALDRLATAWLARGEHGRALRAWRRLLRLCQDTDVPLAPVAAKLAVCLREVGRLDAARSLLERATELLGPEAAVTLAGRRVGLAACARELLAAETKPSGDESWPVVGGDPSQSRLGSKPIRPGRLLWSDTITSREAVLAASAWRARERLDVDTAEGGEPSARVLPIIAGNAAVYPSRNSLTARDLATGKLLWEWPWPLDTGAWRAGGPFAVPSSFVGHWACSAGSKAAFCSTPFQTTTRLGEVGMSGELAAVDLRGGAARWRVTASELLPGDLAAGGWFVCAPLPCGDRLLAGVRTGGGGDEYHLCCLRAKDGGMVWRTFVASRPSDPLYRLNRYQPWFEGMPAESEGLVVTCPGGGVVAAAELATGGLRWLSRYDQVVSRRLGFRWYRRDGWRTWTPVVAEGIVYATPPDSDFLYAIELDSGRMLWRRERRDHRYLAGVRGGRAFIVGSTATCIGPRGDVEWEAELPSPAVARPAIAGHVLHVPLAGGLLFLDTATGSELAWASWDDWRTAHGTTWSAHIASGDLLVAGGRLFITTPFTLNVFGPFERREAIESQLAASPDDPAAHYALGQESHWEGNAAEAAAAFEKTLELAARKPNALPPAALADVRRRLAACYHDVMRRQEAAGRLDLALEACAAALRYAPPGEQRWALQLRAAAFASALRRRQEAAAACQDVLAHAEPGGPPWQAARTRLAAWLAEAGREPYAAFENAAETALKRGTEADLLTVVQRYPNSLSAPRALVALARLADQAARPAQAALWLQQLVRDYPESPPAPAGLYELALRYAREGGTAMARGALARLRRKYPGWKGEAQGQPASSDVEAAAFLAQHAPRGRAPAPAALKPPFAARWQVRPAYGATDLKVVGHGAGPLELLFVLAGRSFECLAAGDGSPRWADRPGWIGISIKDAERRGGGVRVDGIAARGPDSPAERAGLRGGDILVAFDGKRLRDTQDLIATCMGRRPGTTARLEFLRDEEPRVVDLTLGERPSLVDDAELTPNSFVGIAGGNAVIWKQRQVDAVGIERGEKVWASAIEQPPAAEGAEGRLSAAAPGLVALADSRARLLGLDAATGHTLWSSQLDEPTVHNLAVGDHGLAVASSRPASLRVLNPFDGDVLFSVAERHALAPPLFALDTQGRLCYAMGSGVGCYDARQGRALWNVRIPNFTARRLWLAAPFVVAHGVDDQGTEALECRQLDSGDPAWSLSLGRGERALLAELMPDAFYLASRRAASTLVRRLDSSTGAVAWTHTLQRLEELGAWETSGAALALGLTVTDERGARQAELLALDKLTGAAQQRLPLGNGAAVALSRHGSALYAVVDDEARAPREAFEGIGFDEPVDVRRQPPRFRVVRLLGSP
jgi:outer membrane protein assembly factor BamB/tetratricopeptide (TPR) repeat protein